MARALQRGGELKLGFNVDIAARLFMKQESERKRRAEGLPPIRPFIEVIGSRDTGYITKGLKGQVVCEAEVGFVVSIEEDAVIKYLESQGITYHKGRLGMPSDPEVAK